MANSEMLEIVSKEQFDKIQQINKTIEQLVKNINAANVASKNFTSPSQSKGGTSNNNSNTAQANKLLAEQQRLLDKISDAKKLEAIENAKLRLELQKLTAENKKAAQEALGVMSAYQKLSAELNQLRGEAKAVAADMYLLEEAGEKNSEQYRELAATYDLLSRRVTTLNNGLTGIDRNLGDHRRNVGNYESGWNGLGNSINQLTREMPAFANSMQTGFMAISNNIPALIDALQDLNRENDRLRAAGEPTRSVFRQLASSIFSFQTLLSVGVTLLTVYGAKFIEWATSAGKAASQMDILTKAQERFNLTISDTITKSEAEYNTLNQLRSVIADTAKSMEERTDASKRLAAMFPGYYKSEQDILNNTVAYQQATQQLTKDILKRAEAEAKQNKAAENLKIAADIQEEVDLRERTNKRLLQLDADYGGKYAEQQRKIVKAGVDARAEAMKDNAEFIEKFGSVGQAMSGSVNLLGGYDPQAIRELKKRGQELLQLYKEQQAEAAKIMVETSLLDFQGTEETNKLKYESAVDYLASQYELNKLELQGKINYNKAIIEDEEASYADREASAKEYSSLLMQLAELDRAERIRIIEKTTVDEIKELQRRAKDGEITQKNAYDNIKALNLQRDIDIKTASEQFSQDIIGNNKEVENSYKDIYDTLPEQQRQNVETKNQIANLRQMSLLLDNISGSTTSGQFAQVENQMRRLADLEDSQQIQSLQNQRADIDLEIKKIREKERTEKGNEAINALMLKQLAIDKQILDIDNKRKQAVADLYEQMNKSTQEYFNQFSQGIFSDMGLSALGSLFDSVEYQVVNSLGEIETKTGSTFQKMIDQAGSTGQKLGVIFTTMSEIAQQAFNVLNQNSRQNLENSLAEIDMQQRLAERFALTEEAKQQIQDQADEKRREARIKQAEQEKEIALFNAIVDTAQGVVAALSQGPQGIPLAALIAALGAAQIALISSQEIPQFKEGVRGFGGGLAVVGDGGRSEIVRTPDGGLFKTPSTDTLVNLPKGSDVFKSELDYLRNSGTLLGGMPHAYGDMGGLTESGMKKVMRDAMKGAATNVITIGKSGISAYTVSAGKKHSSFNDTVTFRGKTYN